MANTNERILSVTTSTFNTEESYVITDLGKFTCPSEKLSDSLRQAVDNKMEPLCSIRRTVRQIGDPYKDAQGRDRKVGYNELGVELGAISGEQVTINAVIPIKSEVEKKLDEKDLVVERAVKLMQATGITFEAALAIYSA